MGKAGFASISQVQVQLLIPSTSQSKMKPPVPSMTHSAYDIDRVRPNAFQCCLKRCFQFQMQAGLLKVGTPVSLAERVFVYSQLDVARIAGIDNLTQKEMWCNVD